MTLVPGINNVSNRVYHADAQYLSSSSYKLVLQSPYQFYQEKILGNRKVEEEKEHLVAGSLLHTLCLEPHLVDAEYAVFPGLRRAGAAWDAFKIAPENQGKTLVSQSMMQKAKWLQAGVLKNRAAVKLIQAPGNLFEHTVAVADYLGVPTKCRADFINVEAGIIGDLKTSAFNLDPDSVRMTLDKWSYSLSASLYCEVMAQHYGKPFQFVWIFAGKQDADCAVYRMSEKTRDEGLMQVREAARIYRHCMATGIWEKPKPKFHFDEEIFDI